jgi:hypothetical protein
MNENYHHVLILHKYLNQSLLISCGDLQVKPFFFWDGHLALIHKKIKSNFGQSQNKH